MSTSDFISPRKRAIQYILQFCKDEGLDRTHETLVEEFAEIEDSIEAESTSVAPVPFAGLVTAVEIYDTVKEQNDTNDVRRTTSAISKILTSRNETDVEVTGLQSAIPNAHTGNIISVAVASDYESQASAIYAKFGDIIATSSADRTIKISSFDSGDVVYELSNSLPAVGLTLDWNTVPYQKDVLELLVGCMNGEVKLFQLSLDNENRIVIDNIGSWKAHTKYVISVKWTLDGTGFASASHDKTVAFYKRDNKTNQFEKAGNILFSGQVECLDRIYHKDSQQEHNDNIVLGQYPFICGVRDDNRLHIVDLETCSETDTINMNALGDEHVSFTPLSISCSRTNMMLLVATDHHRVICFHLPTKKQVRNYYGARNDGFSLPRVGWVGSSATRPIVTTQENNLHIWDAESQKTLCILKAHSMTIRDMTCHPLKNVIVTVSLDKSIRKWSNIEA